MTEKYLNIDLNDAQAGKVAEVLSNKTAKKILNLLAEKELSQGDIAKELGIGLSNVDYNIKKLIDSGLIEKTSSFFWSVKGKKIPTYRLANKRIIISTKSSFKGIIASVLAGGVIFGGFRMFMNYSALRSLSSVAVSEKASDTLTAISAPAVSPGLVSASSLGIFNNVLVWIVSGIAVGVLGYLIFKFVKGGLNKI